MMTKMNRMSRSRALRQEAQRLDQFDRYGDAYYAMGWELMDLMGDAPKRGDVDGTKATRRIVSKVRELIAIPSDSASYEQESASSDAEEQALASNSDEEESASADAENETSPSVSYEQESASLDAEEQASPSANDEQVASPWGH